MKAIAIPFATLCLAATTHFADDVVLPETPAGAALAGWLEVAREGDAEAVAEHWAARMSSDFKEAVPLDQYAGFMTQVSATLRDADVGRVNEESEHELVVYARFAGTWLQISLSVRATEPHEISGLHVRPGDPPATGPDPLRAGWQDLPELLERVRAAHGFPALAAARMRAGKIVERAAVGVRAHGSEDEALPGDLFHFGSVTKSITATMIGRLIEAGTLD